MSGEVVLGCGFQRDDEPLAAEPVKEAGYLVGVLSVGDVGVGEPAWVVGCECEGCDAGV